MAIHPVAHPVAPSSPPSGGVAIDVQAWTEEASQALGSLSLEPVVQQHAPAPPVRGTSVALDIPLDEQNNHAQGPNSAAAAARASYKRREPLRRDGMSRREELLKGKEGSRQRRRWENDRLLNNPWMQPPLPSDWEVRPTYRAHVVPYYLAPLWDAGLAAHVAAKKEKTRKKASVHKPQKKGEPEGVGRVPKEFKEKMKKSKGAKGLLHDLESEVRLFVEKWQEKERILEQKGLLESDSEDDEVILVDKNGEMHDLSAWESLQRQLLLFDSAPDDQAAAFCRYLVHQIGTYYGLKTWSVTTGDPARREAYVGLHVKTGRAMPVDQPLPRPLWGIV